MSALSPEDFYDALASDYDGMTQFETRLEQQRLIFGALLPIGGAIDMGCGTGLHSIALASLGVEVVGIDLSGEMLARARAHAERHGLHPVFVQGDFFSNPPALSAAPDMLLCLGNSLPHLDRHLLGDVLRHWRSLMSADGRVLIQLLNYRRVLDRRERIVNIRKTDTATVVRFYDFLEDALRFNILTIIENDGAVTHTLRATTLSPFTPEDIATAGRAAGFLNVEMFSSLEFAEFKEDSMDCVAMLRS